MSSIQSRTPSGASASERRDQLEDRVEEPLRIAALAVRLGRRLPELGNQPRELGAARVREPVEDGVAGASQRAQRGDERRERELVVAQLDAGAAEAAHAELVGALDQLDEQAALADARLAGHEGECRELGAAAVEAATSSAN